MVQELNTQKDKSLPLVSVTIPCYNAANTIAETIESVLAQTYPRIETIIIDDGSTDETPEVLKRYASKVRVIRKANGGLASARNAGCRAAQGAYIALMDADDLCVPERVAVQVAYLEQHPEIVMCSSDFTAFNNNGLLADSFIEQYYSRVSETPGGIKGLYPHAKMSCLSGHTIATYSGNVYEQMAQGNFIHPPTVLFRSSLLGECGLVDENIINCCDFDWFVRMSRVGTIGYIDRPLLKYRFSENQMSGPRNILQMALDIVFVMEKTFAADPVLFKRNPGLYRRCLGKAHLGAADVLVDNRPIAAFVHLFHSVVYGVLCLQSLKVLLKAFIPARLLDWMRKMKQYQHTVEQR